MIKRSRRKQRRRRRRTSYEVQEQRFLKFACRKKTQEEKEGKDENYEEEIQPEKETCEGGRVRAWQWRLETGSHISRIAILQVRPRRSFFPYVDERESRSLRPSHTDHPPHVLQCPFFTSSLHLLGPPGALAGSGMRADSLVTFIGSKSRVKRTFSVG